LNTSKAACRHTFKNYRIAKHLLQTL